MDLTNINKDRKNRRQPVSDLNNLVYGKIPPQARDIESAVLGAIMLQKGAFDIAAERLRPESFYVDANQRVFSAMMALANKSMPIDLLTVVEELKRRDELEIVGGGYYVSKLTESVVSSANIETHCLIVAEKFMQREIIRIGGDMISQAYEESTDVFDLLDQVEADVMSITLNNLKKDFSQISKGMVKVIKQLDDLRNQEDSMSGVPSGFKALDRITHGWQPTDLIILAARPSVGKTAFALNLARNAAMDPFKPTPVGLFSLEMSESQLIQRFLSSESEIHLENIRRGRMDEARMEKLYTKGVSKLSSAPIFIDDSGSLNIFELRSKARRMKSKYNVGLIIIDYLQLMTGESRGAKSGNREQEISSISRNLKKLAKDLEVPIIALSQLSREVEKRGKGQKIPQLSDLRESGAIEQDADMVMFLYRPPVDEVKENRELENSGLVRIAKHRNGDLDDVVMRFYGKVQKWMEPDVGDLFNAAMGGSWIPVNSVPGKPPAIESHSKMEDEEEDLPF